MCGTYKNTRALSWGKHPRNSGTYSPAGVFFKQAFRGFGAFLLRNNSFSNQSSISINERNSVNLDAKSLK